MVVYNSLFRCRGLKYFWPDWCEGNVKLGGPDSVVWIVGWEWAYIRFNIDQRGEIKSGGTRGVKRKI